jgi:hypothetical protein
MIKTKTHISAHNTLYEVAREMCSLFSGNPEFAGKVLSVGVEHDEAHDQWVTMIVIDAESFPREFAPYAPGSLAIDSITGKLYCGSGDNRERKEWRELGMATAHATIPASDTSWFGDALREWARAKMEELEKKRIVLWQQIEDIGKELHNEKQEHEKKRAATFRKIEAINKEIANLRAIYPELE